MQRGGAATTLAGRTAAVLGPGSNTHISHKGILLLLREEVREPASGGASGRAAFLRGAGRPGSGHCRKPPGACKRPMSPPGLFTGSSCVRPAQDRLPSSRFLPSISQNGPKFKHRPEKQCVSTSLVPTPGKRAASDHPPTTPLTGPLKEGALCFHFPSCAKPQVLSELLGNKAKQQGDEKILPSGGGS